MEKVRKRFGKSKTNKVGKYRMEHYQVNVDSDIRSVELGCWINTKEYDSLRTVEKNLHYLAKPLHRYLSNNGCTWVIFVPNVKDSCMTATRTWMNLTIQYQHNDVLPEVGNMLIDLVDSSRLNVIIK